MAKLLGCIFTILFAGCMSSQTILRDAINRSVVVDAADGTCTGFVYQTNLIMTAKHCITPTGLWINGKEAKVVGESSDDFILLQVDTKKFRSLTLNFFPQEGEETHEVFVRPDFGRLISFGRIMQVAPNRVYHSTLSIPGSSGSALFDAKGRLLGINITCHGTMLPNGASTLVMGGAVDSRKIWELVTKLNK